MTLSKPYDIQPQFDGVEAGLKKAIRTVVIAVVVLFVLFLSLGTWQFAQAASQRDQIETNARQTHAALCTLRLDLAQQIGQMISFLETHPEGISGLPNELLRQQIEMQKKSVAALDILKCTEDA